VPLEVAFIRATRGGSWHYATNLGPAESESPDWVGMPCEVAPYDLVRFGVAGGGVSG
jgi:hypothetical protein